jgi:small-conductance mechanosensitive channel
MSLITALGVGSLAFGLAAKDTLSNMISGFILIVDRNLLPGDKISLNPNASGNSGALGNSGEVEQIGLRSTRIRTPEGIFLIIPNTDLVNSKILNFSSVADQQACLRVTVAIRLAPQAPYEKIRPFLEETVSALPLRDGSKEFSVRLNNLSDGFQTVAVGFWIRHFKYEDEARAALLTAALPHIQAYLPGVA